MTFSADIPPKLADALSEALNVPRTMRKVDVHFAMGEVCTASVEFLLNEDQVERFVDLLLQAEWKKSADADQEVPQE